MKYTFQWKDPDYYDGVDISDEDRPKLRALGAGEYLIVEFDTEEGTATVIKPKQRS